MYLPLKQWYRKIHQSYLRAIDVTVACKCKYKNFKTVDKTEAEPKADIHGSYSNIGTEPSGLLHGLRFDSIFYTKLHDS